MHIKTKLYPYPVLSNFTNDYFDSYFNVKIEQPEFNNDKVVIKLKKELTNDGIEQLIKDGKAKCIVHIESTSTCYRKIAIIEDELKLEIQSKKLEKVLTICPFIVAINNITSYTNEKFNQDFNGLSFDFERGNILAIGKEFCIKIDKKDDEIKYLPSIFGITEIKDENEKNIKIDIEDSKKIYIRIPTKAFGEYKLCWKNPNAKSIFFSTLCIPALMKCFDKFKENPSEMYLYEDKRWFRAIRNALKKQGFELNEESICSASFDSYEKAQQLMDSPVANALYEVNHLSIVQGEEDDE